MGFYTRKQKANAEYSGRISIENGGELDVESGGVMKIAGTAVTASAAEMNLLDLGYQLLVADGPITVKNGLCAIAKTVAGVVAATLANPTAGIDDFKRLTIVNAQAQANTVTLTGGFGGGGAGEDVCTFSGVIGDCLSLMAYGGKWYITGSHQATIA